MVRSHKHSTTLIAAVSDHRYPELNLTARTRAPPFHLWFRQQRQREWARHWLSTATCIPQITTSVVTAQSAGSAVRELHTPQTLYVSRRLFCHSSHSNTTCLSTLALSFRTDDCTLRQRHSDVYIDAVLGTHIPSRTRPTSHKHHSLQRARDILPCRRCPLSSSA